MSILPMHDENTPKQVSEAGKQYLENIMKLVDGLCNDITQSDSNYILASDSFYNFSKILFLHRYDRPKTKTQRNNMRKRLFKSYD
jgi:hypothetical protein